jgi:small redox-active disulfide protein 2
MKTIHVLGATCRSCRKLAENAEAAARELGIDFELIAVSDITQIMEYGVMMTPALVVDGEVKVVGTVPSVEELKPLIG